MMRYIAHRVNTIEELRKLPDNVGVELDLRDGMDGRIYLQHDPFIAGEDFERYAAMYAEKQKGTMILNIKSERIEWKALDILQKYGVKDYFFLDSTFPMIKAMSDKDIREIALRLSEWEGMDTLYLMRKRVKWVWIDCFERFVLSEEKYHYLKEWGYKLCVVSPELQSQSERIEEYAKKIVYSEVLPDAICTKAYNIKRWKEFLNEQNNI